VTRYLAHEAARLVGVSGDRIGQWARWGHIRASVSEGDPHVYSWEDVAEALAVHDLLEAGYGLRVIRAAVDRLGGPSAHPLSTAGVHDVDGRLAVERGDVLVDVFNDQGVLPFDGRVRATELLRGGGWPGKAWPAVVEVDPLRLGGVPCLAGRRLPVEVAAGVPEALWDDYGLDAVTADAARRWWALARSYER
jgi:DNA-binding transcriptional MerR regulator